MPFFGSVVEFNFESNLMKVDVSFVDFDWIVVPFLINEWINKVDSFCLVQSFMLEAHKRIVIAQFNDRYSASMQMIMQMSCVSKYRLFCIFAK